MAKRVHDIELKFIASLKDFEAKLAEMPGMTEKQVKKASNRFLKEWQKTQKTLRKVSEGGASKALGEFSDETERASQKLKTFEDSAGEADSILAALGGGLSEISPTAGAFVQAFAEGASVLEATARSGAGLVRVLGPLGVAVGAGALAYRELSKGLEEANEKIETQREKLGEVEALHRAVKEAALLHRLALGEITEAQFAEIGAAQKASDLFGPMLEEMNKERSELGSTISKERKELDKNTESAKKANKVINASIHGGSQLTTQNERSADVLNNLEDQYDALETRIEHVQGAQERYKTSLIATQKTEADKKSLESRIDLLEEYEEQLKSSASIIEEASLKMPTLDVDTGEFGKLVEKYREELSDIEIAYSNNTDALEDVQTKQVKTARKLGIETTQLVADQLTEREKLESEYIAGRNVVFENSEKAAQDFIKETSAMLDDELEKFSSSVSKFAPAESIFEKTKSKYEKQFADFEISVGKSRSKMEDLHKEEFESSKAMGEDLNELFMHQRGEQIEFEQTVVDARLAIQDKANEEMRDNYINTISDMTSTGLSIINELAGHQLRKSAETAETLRILLENEDAKLTADQKKNIQARLEEEQKMADKLFRLQQTAAVISIVMDTAAAMVKAVKQLGPIAGALAAAGVFTFGAIQAGVVLSQSPPQLHTGGLVDDVAPDEINTRLLRSEMVLNPQGVSTLGRDAIDAANSGRGGGMSQTVVIQWRNRVLDVVTEDIGRRPSPIRAAIRRNRRSGHRRR